VGADVGVTALVGVGVEVTCWVVARGLESVASGDLSDWVLVGTARVLRQAVRVRIGMMIRANGYLRKFMPASSKPNKRDSIVLSLPVGSRKYMRFHKKSQFRGIFSQSSEKSHPITGDHVLPFRGILVYYDQFRKSSVKTEK